MPTHGPAERARLLDRVCRQPRGADGAERAGGRDPARRPRARLAARRRPHVARPLRHVRPQRRRSPRPRARCPAGPAGRRRGRVDLLRARRRRAAARARRGLPPSRRPARRRRGARHRGRRSRPRPRPRARARRGPRRRRDADPLQGPGLAGRRRARVDHRAPPPRQHRAQLHLRHRASRPRRRPRPAPPRTSSRTTRPWRPRSAPTPAPSRRSAASTRRPAPCSRCRCRRPRAPSPRPSTCAPRVSSSAASDHRACPTACPASVSRPGPTSSGDDLFQAARLVARAAAIHGGAPPPLPSRGHGQGTLPRPSVASRRSRRSRGRRPGPASRRSGPSHRTATMTEPHAPPGRRRHGHRHRRGQDRRHGGRRRDGTSRGTRRRRHTNRRRPGVAPGEPGDMAEVERADRRARRSRAYACGHPWRRGRRPPSRAPSCPRWPTTSHASRDLASAHDLVVVEGAGGLLVELTDAARRWPTSPSRLPTAACSSWPGAHWARSTTPC